MEEWLWTDLPEALDASSPPWYLVVGLPIVGAALVLAARRLLPGDGGHPPLNGIGGGATPWQHGPGIALAAIGTLAFGAVLGPEAPLIALGSVVGVLLVSMLPADADPRAKLILGTAGSFSAVSALFGGPLVAGILLLEGGLAAGAALTPMLLPGLVAAAVGYVMFVGLGDWGGIDEASLSVADLPAYEGTHVDELLLAVGVGVVAAVVVFAVRRAALTLSGKVESRMAVGLLAGGAVVGLVAWIAGNLGDATSQEVLFSGQAALPAVVAETSIATILVLLVAKGIGYAVSLGCGYRGGPVFPAVFLGVAVAMCCVIWFDASPTWAVAVGTAAGMTAGTRLVFSSLLLGSLLVGSSAIDALPAAVLASAASWITTSALDPAPEPAPA